MRVILTLMWGVVLLAFWTAPEGWTADKKQRDKKQPDQRAKNWPWKVEGLATDLARAKENAIENARMEIIKRLRMCNPPIMAWQPSGDYIQNSLEKSAVAGEDLVVDGVKSFKRCILELNPPNWDEFYRLDAAEQKVQRHQRGEVRMVLLAKVLAGVLVLLLAAIVYVRLDDWTQGYYTRWLQVAGASLIVGLGTGLWLLS
jgi:hypothetical protein